MPLLERLVPRDELMQALTELQRLDLIVEKRRRPNPEYRFRHGLVQEVAYASLVDSKRRKLHKRVGEALEDIYKESPEEAYGLLARHFSRGRRAGEGGRLPAEGGRRCARRLRRPRGARALPQGARRSSRASATSAARATRSSRWRSPTTSPSTSRRRRRCTTRRSAAASTRSRGCAPTERLETASGRPGVLSPGEVYSTEAGYFAELLFRGLLMVDSELNVVPAMADNFRVSSRRPHLPLPHQGGRPLERRRAPHRRRLRLRLATDARAGDAHGVPDGGRRDGRGARRPHARGPAPRAAELLPVRPLLGLGVPLAAPPLRGARRRLGEAGEPRRERAVRARRVRRRACAPAGQPALDGRARQRRARSTSRSTPKGANMVDDWREGRFDLLHV